jgi:hypothetical protein
MKTTFMVAALLTTLAGLAFTVGRVRDQTRAIDGLRKDLESRLEDQAAKQRLFEATSLAAIARPEPGVPSQSTTTPPVHNTVDDKPGSGLAPKPVTDEQLRQGIADTFAKEVTGSAQAQQRRSLLASRIQTVLSGSSELKDLDCRGSLCRLETVHADTASFRKFLDAAIRNPETRLGTGGYFALPSGKDERGRTVSVIYLAADGEPLPPPDQM